MARRKSDRDKGPIGAWATKQRDRRGWTPADVVRALEAVGQPITEGTYRGIEAGPRPPSRAIIGALERVFEVQAPDPHEPLPEPGNMAALVQALHEQTATMQRLIEVLTENVSGRRVALDPEVVDEIEAAHRDALELERDEQRSDEPRPTAEPRPRDT